MKTTAFLEGNGNFCWWFVHWILWNFFTNKSFIIAAFICYASKYKNQALAKP